MTRTITVTQTEPREAVMIATERDETLERHLRRTLNAMPGLAYSQYETKHLAVRLQEHGYFEIGDGRTVVLTEHIEEPGTVNLPLDPAEVSQLMAALMDALDYQQEERDLDDTSDDDRVGEYRALADKLLRVTKEARG